jgi:hypothetical protein
MTPDTPQFSTAEYAGTMLQPCLLCGAPLGGEYYRVRGQAACPSCASAAGMAQPADNQAAFSQALLLGAAAALAGLVVYAGFTVLTGFYFGYVALGVGYLVARAMKFGSGRRGGRAYQIAAVTLTYISISLAAIPIAIWPRHGGQVAWDRVAHASGRLLMLGLCSPFLEMRDPVHGLIGAVILFIGLRIAWRMTAAGPRTIEGPFRIAPAAR